MDKYGIIKEDVLWVLKNYGSDAIERENPGSKVESQAARIIKFIRQLDEAKSLLEANNLDLITVTGHKGKD